MFRKSAYLSVVLVVACAVSIGCRRGPAEPKRVPVTGAVTLDGKPMAKGTIYFKTVDQGSADRMEIHEGRFEGAAELGPRRVEISQFVEGPPTKTPLGELPNVINKVPAKYNTQSNLTATISDSGANEFKFAVTSN